MFDTWYEAAVAEVRGTATPKQIELLQSDNNKWVDALQRVMDELDSQMEYREDLFRDETEYLTASDFEFNEKLSDHNRWKKGMRTFKKHISSRLVSLKREFGMEDTFEHRYHDISSVIRRLHDADVAEDDDEFDSALEVLYRYVPGK